MRKAYFCYEQHLNGSWTPVVYYDDKPVMVNVVAELTTDDECFFSADESPRFGHLVRAYPHDQ